jgi:DNA (cytosine-5)-methyltransferase 1
MSLIADGRKPRLLDLFCGAGGAGTGYARAGFEVVGVDRDSQPNYPFTFIRADALGLLSSPWFDVSAFDAIHASPPCQAYAGLAAKDERHPKLIEPTRELLRATGLPYVIENIADAKHALIEPVRVCGSSFGLHVRRHRLFESNVPLMGSSCAHGGQEIRAYYGKPGWLAWNPRGAQVQKAGRKPLLRGSVEQAPADMEIDWMTWDELREAIPPAYTEFIGAQVLARLSASEVERVAA